MQKEDNWMIYSRACPFLASIKERYRLNKSESLKNTQHIVLDIRNSGIEYKIGDSVGILPSNDPKIVERTIKAMRANEDEIVVNRRTGEKSSLGRFLLHKANISDIDKGLFRKVLERQSDLEKKRKLEDLLLSKDKTVWKEYMKNRELWDFLEENAEAELSSQEICDYQRSLLPRLYSIASSMKIVGEEIHLTIAKIEYESNGRMRYGVATNYLCSIALLNDPCIPIYIQPSNGFTLPKESNRPIIMVGPGTGIAPFCGFMQERMSMTSRNENWLFFGEWNRSYDFLYEDFFLDLEKKGKLRLDLAFSRDQEKKIYVQHKMKEKAKDVWRWLENGAYFYVCGDARDMAKSVDLTLHDIIEKEGNMSSDKAKFFIQKMKEEKRYLRDVY